ncbi:NAD(P)/FAD-dependent oxidoreductase [Aureimonas populi]|uniref:NAD(P)/FAD-dependent oxidoreductase n=1 Tax=Aureimonas populi TaxID=1701758 RepID=A0ABW5CLM0_9HYPH|nr:FAD-dependent oxidoreductase [Aureimonas populi]
MSAGAVIVGASHAGVQLAASLRQSGWGEAIRLVSAEPSLPYHRPPLSKAFLTGRQTAEQIVLKGPDFYAAQGIDLMLATRVEAVLPHEKRVVLADGESLAYSALVLATGASARRPALPGAGLAGLHVLRDLADASGLKAVLEAAGSIAILGGGYIGLEVASSAVEAGKRVTVVEMQDRLLARSLPPSLSHWILELHRSRGVDVRLGARVRRFMHERGRARGIEIEGAEPIEADLVLVGIGSQARTGLAASFGVPLSAGGILVDERGRTGLDGVYAIGDCAAQRNGQTGEVTRVESVQNAVDQARRAASDLTGTPLPPALANWFWSDQYEHKIQIAGLMEPGCREILRGDRRTGRFSVLMTRDGRLRTVVSVGSPADHMSARKLVAEGAVLDHDRARDIATPLAKAVLSS